MLPTSEIIRNMRREKNVTQDELAQALGVTFQSVSRWENGQAYPDIELIPKIAAFFGITTDHLLGADEETRRAEREKRIREYMDVYWDSSDPYKIYLAMSKGHAEFPDEERFTVRALEMLVRKNALPRDEALPIVRGYCKNILENSHDNLNRSNALSYIYEYEDEERLPEWSKYVSESTTVPQLLAGRYKISLEVEKFNKQSQINLFTQLDDAFESWFWQLDPVDRRYKNMDPVRIEAGQQMILKMLDTMTDDPAKADGWISRRLITYVRLAAAQFKLGKKEEAYDSVDKAVNLLEIIESIPEKAEIRFNSPVFDQISVRRYDQFIMNNPTEWGNCADRTSENLYGWLTMDDGLWEWFAPYRGEDRYKTYLDRIAKYLPDDYFTE